MVATLVLVLTILGTVLPMISPTSVLAANGSWSQTTFAGSSDGTYASTSKSFDGTSVGLTESKLSNNGGGSWNYRKKITINNSGGSALTDYQVSVDSENDLVGHWNFDEGTGSTANDSSWNGGNGSVYGTSPWTTAGRYGNAFLGNSATTNRAIISSAVTQNTTSGSVEAWVKLTAYPTAGSWAAVIAKYSSAAAGYRLLINDVGTVLFQVSDGAGDDNAQSSVGVVVLNTWYHIVGTWSAGAGTNLYLNGVKSAGPVGTRTISYSATPPDINIGRNIAEWYLTGSIDEVKVFSKPLSANEVWNNFQVNRYAEFNKIQSDGDDIRFTDSDGKTELNYWLEGFNNATTGKKSYKSWVKVPSIPANSSKDIYLYYGNGSATSSANGNNVFSLYDDFNDSSYNTSKWLTIGGSPTETGGYLFLPRSSSTRIESKIYSQLPVIVESRIKKLNIGSTTYDSSGINFISTFSPVDYVFVGGHYADGRCAYPISRTESVVDGSWQGFQCLTGSVTNDSLYHNFKIIATTSSQALSIDKVTNSWAKTMTQGDYKINITTYDPSYGTDLYVDHIFTRAYSATEPTITESGGLSLQYYKKDVTFNTSATGANIATAQYDFPIAVHVNSSSMPSATERSHFFGDYNTAGKGVQFWESDESMALDYEVEYYDAATQEAVYWVRIPKVDGNSTTDKIIMAYGRSSGTDQDNKADTWINGFLAVYHLGDNSWGTAPEAKNSVSSNYSLTNTGSTSATGLVRQGRNVNGSAQYLNTNTSLTTSVKNYTISANVKLNTIPTWDDTIAYNGDDMGGYGLLIQGDGVNSKVVVLMGNLVYITATDLNISDTSNFHYIATKRNTTTTNLYLDSAKSSVTNTSTPYVPNAHFTIGGQYYPGSSQFTRFTNGILDEIRFANTSRTDDWLKLENKSMAKSAFNGDVWLGYTAETSGNYVATGYATSGSFTTVVLPAMVEHQGKVYQWNNFTFEHTLNGQSINYDILDSITGNIIPGHGNITTASPIDITGINATVYPSIKIRANFAGDGTTTALLGSLTVDYSYDLTAPTIPTGLGVNTVTSSAATLSWTSSTDTESSASPYESTIRYEVQRAPDSGGIPGTWVTAGGTCSSSVAGNSCIDDTLTPNTKYYFRVRAKDAVGNYSTYSGEQNVDVNTVALWHLNEASGVTAVDSSGNANTGYLRDTQLYNMDSTSGWSVCCSNTAPTLNTTIKREGTGAINVIKNTTTDAEVYIQNAVSATNITGKNLNVWMYVKDQTALDKIQSAQIYTFTPDLSSFQWTTIPKTGNIAIGWNLLTMDTAAPSGTVGTPVLSNVQSFRVDANTMLATNTFAEGDLIIDDWYLSDKKQAAGKYSNALSFDGINDYITMGNPASIQFNTNTPFSVEAWIKAPSSSTNMAIVSKTSNIHGVGWYLWSWGGDHKAHLTLSDGVANYEVVSSGIVTDNTWHYISATYDGSQNRAGMKIYVDGVLSGSGASAPMSYSISGSSPVNIGSANNATSFFAGTIDEVRISNIARTNTEINRSYVDGTLSTRTLTNTPILNPPTAVTSNSKPPVSNSATPDTSLANRTIKLYVGATQVAQTTANGSGVFTFVEGDYSQSISDGEHTDIIATALNSDNVEGPPSIPITIHVDTEKPIQPTTVLAYTDSTMATEITDNDWSGHNNLSSIYLRWTGANDGSIPPNSGVYRYWVYFGPNASALPRTDGIVTLNTNNEIQKTLSSPVTGIDYYVRIQTEDEAGNISDDGLVTTLFTYKYDNVAPGNIDAVSVSPSFWSETDSFNFTWSGGGDVDSGLAGYQYKRNNGTDDWTTTTDTGINDIKKYQTGVNYLLVRTIDGAGNYPLTPVSWPYFYSGAVGKPQNVQTDISQSAGGSINNFKFTWEPPLVGTTEGYYYSVNAAPNPENATYTTNPYTDFGPFAKLNGVANTFYVVAKDEFGNVGWNNAETVSFIVNTVAPEVPQNVNIVDVSDRSTENWALTVSWSPLIDQPIGFDGYEVWRCTSQCDNLANFNDKRATVTTNIYSEASLDNVTDFYYVVKSHDNVGNTSTFSLPVHKIPTGRYIQPPTYTSDPTVVPKALSAQISWTTNRISNSIIQYGTSTSYTDNAGEFSTYVTDHSYELSGLLPGTTYHYRVQSLDRGDYVGYSEEMAYTQDGTFTTLSAPGISAVETKEIRLNSVIITWKTTSSSTSKILYGKTNAYGLEYTDNSGSQTTTHTVQLTGLTDSTTYNFKIQGTDIDDNLLTSDNYVFTTLTYPRLSNLKIEQVKNSATSTVKVSFDSNVPTTSQVVITGNGGKEVSDYTLKNARSFTISGLADNTNYQITTRARDEYGNEADSLSSTYKTEFDTRPPAITSVSNEVSTVGVGSDTKGQAVISWETDEPATSQVEYAIGVSGDHYDLKTQEDTNLTTSHVVIITGLKPSTSYHFRTIARDAANNIGYSEDNSVLTEQATSSVLDLIINSLENSIGWLFGAFRFGR